MVALESLMPGVAAADGLAIPGLSGLSVGGSGIGSLGIDGLGFGATSSSPRPSYRAAYNGFPPPQHNILGMPEPPPSPYDRPSYRQSYQDFPPANGRFGGGLVEYVITGGRSGGPNAPGYGLTAQPRTAYASPAYSGPLYPPAAPSYAAISTRRRLPVARLPEYAPNQPAAGYDGGDLGQR